MSYVYMKSLENKAEKYDMGIKTLTLGKYPKIKQYIVDEYLEEGEYLLDIGMGTGTFAIRCAKKGVKVTGIDVSEKMLEVAKDNIKAEGVSDMISINNIPVVYLDEEFEDKSFDKVTAMLSFSEMYEKEQDFALQQIQRILKERGELIIVDEVKPKRFWKRVLYYIIRIPLAFVTFLKSRLTTKPLRDVTNRAERINFTLIEEKRYLLGSLAIFRFEKGDE